MDSTQKTEKVIEATTYEAVIEMTQVSSRNLSAIITDDMSAAEKIMAVSTQTAIAQALATLTSGTMIAAALEELAHATNLQTKAMLALEGKAMPKEAE